MTQLLTGAEPYMSKTRNYPGGGYTKLDASCFASRVVFVMHNNLNSHSSKALHCGADREAGIRNASCHPPWSKGGSVHGRGLRVALLQAGRGRGGGGVCTGLDVIIRVQGHPPCDRDRSEGCHSDGGQVDGGLHILRGAQAPFDGFLGNAVNYYQHNVDAQS